MNVIFDMDGLMFDTERLSILALDYAGEKLGLGKTGYMTFKTLGMNMEKSNEVWMKEFGDKHRPMELLKFINEFFFDYYRENRVPIKKGLLELLVYLKENKFKTAIASSSNMEDIKRNLKNAGISDFFDVMVSGDMVNHSKPHPEIYLKACQALDIDPSESFALEDSRNGLISAFEAGCNTIMVPDLWQPDDEILSKPIRVFEDLYKVKEALENGSLTEREVVK